jgi:Rod binding domain-containing protein
MSPFGANDIARESAKSTANKLGGLPQFQMPGQLGSSSVNGTGQLTDEIKRDSETSGSADPSSEELRKAFQDFVGQTLFSQMIGSMRSTTQGAAYFNGGQAEKIFQGQLDQMLSEQLSEASASQISDPMFKLFQLRRG